MTVLFHKRLLFLTSLMLPKIVRRFRNIRLNERFMFIQLSTPFSVVLLRMTLTVSVDNSELFSVKFRMIFRTVRNRLLFQSFPTKLVEGTKSRRDCLNKFRLKFRFFQWFRPLLLTLKRSVLSVTVKFRFNSPRLLRMWLTFLLIPWVNFLFRKIPELSAVRLWVLEIAVFLNHRIMLFNIVGNWLFRLNPGGG